MNNDNENLNDLLSNFLDEQQALQARLDIECGDKILSDNPAPEPDKIMIDSIRSRISTRLNIRKQATFHTIARRMAVAAVIIVLVMTGIKFNGHKEQEITNVSGISKNLLKQIWLEEDTSDIDDSSQLAVLTAQVDDIADDLLTIRLDEFGTEETDDFIDLETELTEINGDFWKG